MQLYNVFSSDKSSVGKYLQRLKNNINSQDIWRPLEEIKFVFLCGANIRPEVPSKRRQRIYDFCLKNLPQVKLFYAESFFQAFKEDDLKYNLLDIENRLFEFSDYVIIVLESESSFCELGAFASNPQLRKKLIVINDIQHKNAASFINLGAIYGVEEATNGKNVLYYKMTRNGKSEGDAIGVTFVELNAILHQGTKKTRRSRVESLDPSKYLNKDSLRFVHDILNLINPITISELVEIVKILFGTEKRNRLSEHLGILLATKQIAKKKDYYTTLKDSIYFDYGHFDLIGLKIAAKHTIMKYDPGRLICR